MSQTRQKAPRFGKAAIELYRSVCKELFDPYRPELHYMRGPGPRWHAKHALVPVSTQSRRNDQVGAHA